VASTDNFSGKAVARTGIQHQSGMTLLECVIAVALGALVLAGTSHLLNVALTGYQAGHQKESPEHRIRQVMDRIVWAMETATRRKKSELSKQNDPTKSGDWFERTDAAGKKIKLEYRWDDTSRVLRESDDSTGLDYGILNNVTNFSVTSPDDTEMAVVRVSLTVGDPPDQVTLVEKRRLGGPW
jgi:prepilin-type N-terminal cleavage/methylation domain-containing protein